MSQPWPIESNNFYAGKSELGRRSLQHRKRKSKKQQMVLGNKYIFCFRTNPILHSL